MIHYRSFAMQGVRLTGRKETTFLVNFPAFSNRIMMTTLQIHGQSAKWYEALIWRAVPGELKKQVI